MNPMSTAMMVTLKVARISSLQEDEFGVRNNDWRTESGYVESG
jgi:hypothetical protein